MRRRLLCAALLLPVAQRALAAGDEAAAAGFDADRLHAAVAAFRQEHANLHALLVERHGRLAAEAYRRGRDESIYTLLPRETQFGPEVKHDMRSVSKSVTSLLWGIADGQGRMPPLATPALDLFPDLADLKNGGRERITLEHLFMMSSGLAWDESGYGSLFTDENGLMWHRDQARYLFERPLVAQPGTRFNYDGGHTAVLARIIAERTGQPLAEYARHALFEPLGISDWEWVKDLHGRALAYAGLRLRPRDLLRIGRMVLDGGRWQGRTVVPQTWLRFSLDSHIAIDEDRSYGWHWWAGTVPAGAQRVVWKAAVGNGGQRLFLVPALDLAIAITAGEYNNMEVSRRLFPLLGKVVAACR